MVTSLTSRLTPRTVGRAFALAQHATAATVLAGAIVIGLVMQSASLDLVIWPAVAAVIPQLAMLVLTSRSLSTLTAIAYLVIGSGSVYSFTVTIATQLAPLDATTRAFSALPSVALLLVGGSGVGVLAGFAWCTSGYLLASLASSLGLMQVGLAPRFDVLMAGIYVFTVVVLLLVWFSSRAERKASPGLARATSDQLAARLRSGMESRSAALLHDTVLSHLTAVATSTTGIPPAMRDEMARDLEGVFDEGWLDAAPSWEGTRGSDSRRADSFGSLSHRADSFGSGSHRADSPLARTLRDMSAGALDIDFTGDPARFDLLDPRVQGEVALAVRQCLVNVLKHSGTRDAEVAVSGSDSEVLIMVIDTGKGFVEADVPGDRLGLRASIRGRITDVGGTVQVWSTVDLGTSVLLRIPVHRAPVHRAPVPPELATSTGSLTTESARRGPHDGGLVRESS